MRQRSLVMLGEQTILAISVSFVFIVGTCFAQPQPQPSGKHDESLKGFLQSYIGRMPTEISKGTRYSAAFVDLRDDGVKEAIVYLTGPWCGTAGCTMLILAPEGTSYRVVAKIPGVRLPIRVLATKSNGWRDVGVVSRKNGVEPLYEAILSFDGKTYPDVAEGAELHRKVQGRAVMTETTEDFPLYRENQE